jgi:hypothetical protein
VSSHTAANAVHRPFQGHGKELAMKKVYRRPVLAVHGRATEQTRGKPDADVNDYMGGFRNIR